MDAALLILVLRRVQDKRENNCTSWNPVLEAPGNYIANPIPFKNHPVLFIAYIDLIVLTEGASLEDNTTRRNEHGTTALG